MDSINTSEVGVSIQTPQSSIQKQTQDLKPQVSRHEASNSDTLEPNQSTKQQKKTDVKTSQVENQDLLRNEDVEKQRIHDQQAANELRIQVQEETQAETQLQQELKKANTIGSLIDFGIKLIKNRRFQAIGVSGVTALILAITNAPNAAEAALVIGSAMGGRTFGNDKLVTQIRNTAAGALLAAAAYHVGPDLPQVGGIVEHAVNSKSTGTIGSQVDDIILGSAGIAVESGKSILRRTLGSKMARKP